MVGRVTRAAGDVVQRRAKRFDDTADGFEHLSPAHAMVRFVLPRRLLFALLCLSCTRPSPTPTASQPSVAVSSAAALPSTDTAPPLPGVPLLETISRPPNGDPSGYRFWPDGRYEELGPGNTPRDVWILKRSYTLDEVAHYLDAASKIDLSKLGTTYEARARDATRRHVRLQVGGTVREVDIVGTASPPEIVALEMAMVVAKPP
jgi:hypothetical protein